MKNKTTLPKGLVDKYCEWFDPAKLGGLPPVQFIPNLAYAEETEESRRNRVKITILDSIQKYFPVFTNGGTEDVVNLICTRESIIADKKLEEQYDKLKKLHKSQKEALKELKNQTGDTRQQQAEKETAIAKTKQGMQDINVEAFDFFKKLLANDHIPKWHEICANVCDEHTHVDLEGVRCDERLGRNFASLKHCYLQVLLTVTKQDAAERMRRYISMTVKMADSSIG